MKKTTKYTKEEKEEMKIALRQAQRTAASGIFVLFFFRVVSVVGG